MLSSLTIKKKSKSTLFVLCRFADAVPLAFPDDAKAKVGAMFEKFDQNDDEGFYLLVKLFRSLLASVSTQLPPSISGKVLLAAMTKRMQSSSSLKVRKPQI